MLLAGYQHERGVHVFHAHRAPSTKLKTRLTNTPTSPV